MELDIDYGVIGAIDPDDQVQTMGRILKTKKLIAPQPDKKKALLPSEHKQESKTRRVQLLMRPGTVTTLQAKAKAQGISFNELLNLIAEEYLAK